MTVTRTAISRQRTSPSRRGVWDAVLLAAAATLVLAAALIGRALMERGVPIHAPFPPLQGEWQPRIGWASLVALAVAAIVVVASNRWVFTARWRVVVWASMGASLAWLVSLALTDTWRLGIAERLTRSDEYLSELPRITNLGEFFGDFTASIPADAADPWTVHVSSHPPGAMLPFWLLDRIGLAGGTWAAIFTIVVGASAVGAALITVRSLADERTARRLAPFLVLSPAAIWVAVSADALFMATSAWGVTCLALACVSPSARRSDAYAVCGGLLLVAGLYLSYGLAIGLVIAGAVVLFFGTRRIALIAVAVAALVAVGVTAAGFNWWEGSQLLVERYHAGWGGTRPYAYWVWANLAVFTVVVGPAAIVGGGRLARWRTVSARTLDNRERKAVTVLVVGALVAVTVATLVGLSKGEVERIWLPFTLWAMVACAAVPVRAARPLLIAQAAIAVAIANLVATPW